MPKQNKIKYRESDLNEMRRLVRNFNQRRAYQIKKHPETANLQPPKMSVKKVKQSVYSRDDYNKWKKYTNQYNSESAKVVTNKYGVKSTKYEIEVTKQQVRARNRRKKEESESKKTVYVNGKKVKTAAKATTEQEAKPIKQDFNKMTTQKAWNEFKKAFKKLEGKREQQEKAAYYAHLKQAFDTNIANDELWQLYEALGTEKIYELYLNGLDSVDIDFIYDSAIEDETKETVIFEELTEQIKINGKIPNLIKRLRKYYEVDKNPELKEAWNQLTDEQIFELYQQGFQINNPDEMLQQVNRFRDKKKRNRKK